MISPLLNRTLEKIDKKAREIREDLQRQETFEGILEAFDQNPPRQIYIRANLESFLWLFNSASFIYNYLMPFQKGQIVSMSTPWYSAKCFVDHNLPNYTYHVGTYKGQQDLRAKFPEFYYDRIWWTESEDERDRSKPQLDR